jgi:hypothetical protein
MSKSLYLAQKIPPALDADKAIVVSKLLRQMVCAAVDAVIAL